MIQIKTYSIPANITLTSQVLENYINSFWKEIFDKIKDSHLMLYPEGGVKFNFQMKQWDIEL